MNITLIGMSGVGKSRIGKLFAEKLGFAFIDIDRVIEEHYGKKLQEIIDYLGEEKFKQKEEKTILSLAKMDNEIISTGGSVVYSDKAMKHLKNFSTIVFLNASLEEIKRHTAVFSDRGIVGLKEKGLDALFEERLPLYRKYADLTINLKKDSSDECIVNSIKSALMDIDH